MLARRRSSGVDAGMARWLTHVLRYSRRDQLSFVHAMHEADAAWSAIELDNRASAAHEWRTPVGRTPRAMTFQVAASLQPPAAALGELRLSFDATVADLWSAAEDRRREAERLEHENAQLRERQATDSAEIGRLRRRVGKLRRDKLMLERDLASQSQHRPRRGWPWGLRAR
jgi:hypothetical protein